MRYLLSFLAILIGLFSFSLQGQEVDTLWTRTYGGDTTDIGISVVESQSNDGYVIAGWTYSYGNGNRDVYIVKTDTAGNVQWEKTYGGTDYDLANSIKRTEDGGYIVIGTTHSFGAGSNDFYLLKLSANGDTLWTRTYGDWPLDRGRDVEQLTNGGYILVGGSVAPAATNDYDYYLIKTDSLGDTLWTKRFGGTDKDMPYDVEVSNDQGYIIAGFTESFGSGSHDAYIVKTDSLGNQEWAKTYGSTSSDNAYSIVPTSDGGYIFTGRTDSYSAGDFDAYIVKLDSLGIVEYQKTYGDSLNDAANDVIETTDGNYIVAGGIKSYTYNIDVYLLKIDMFCDTLWTKRFGGFYKDAAKCIQELSNNNYIMTGETYSSGSSDDADVYLLRTYIADITPPIIDSTTMWNDTTYSGPFPVYSKVIDSLSDVDSVLLYYRRDEDPSWFYDIMTEGGNNWYSGVIPEVYQSNDTVKYYIYAKDNAQTPNTATDPEGAPGSYYSFLANATGIDDEENIPEKLSLLCNEIISGETDILFGLPEESDVRIRVYNITGQEVKELINDRMEAGYYELKWKGYDNYNGKLSEGIYFLKITANMGELTKKIILLK